jgi:predicted transcriptional regulator
MLKGLLASRLRRVERDPLRTALGSLERQVMEIVWQGQDVTVRDVLAHLPRPVAYTTAMTTLDRLYKKGLVARTRSGRAFVYTAAWSREQLQAAVASGVLTGLLSHGSGAAAMPILSNLVDAVSREDGGLDLLNTLEELVREKRRRIEKDEA